MTQAQQFLQFVQQRRQQAIEETQVFVRLDRDALVITCRWQHTSVGTAGADGTLLPSPEAA